jgi:hypothetical protein
MNLLSTIGQYIRDGLSHAEIVVKLDVEHAIQVSEEWVAKLRGADGFALVAHLPEEAAAEAVDLTQSAEAEVKTVAEDVAKDVLPGTAGE